MNAMKRFIIKNKILIIILLLGLFVRIVGIYPGHPPTHPDEPMSFGSAIEMIVNKDLNPRRFDYPAGVPLFHYIFFKTFIIPFLFIKTLLTSPGIIIDSFQTGTNFIKLNPDMIIGYNGIVLLFASRFFTAFLGALSVFLVYKIGEKLFNKSIGIFSAFFLVFNYRHVLSSHLALSDIPNSFFVLVAFYACVLLLEKNTLKRYLLVGFCIGLSVSMKYQIFALFPFLLVQLLLTIKHRDIRYLFHKNFIIALLLIPLVFVLLNPYLLLNLETALPVIEIVSRRYGVGANKFNHFALFYLYKWGITAIPFFLIIFGMILMTFKNIKKSIFLFSYVGIFFYVFLYYTSGGGYVRNFTTVLPLLMIFAGYGLYEIANFFRIKVHLDKKAFFILSAFLLIVSNLSSIENSISLDIEYSKPWSQEVLNAWADKNIPEKSRILTDPVGISSRTTKKFDLIGWSHSKENSIEEFSDARDDFAVLNIAWHQIYLFWFDIKPKELLLTRNIPYKKLKNSYYGLSLSEFMNYSVWDTYKSWQAPEDSYIVIKVPAFPKDLQKIREYHFDKDMEGWRFYDFSRLNKIEKVLWNNDGNNEPGSIELTGNIMNTDFSRLISPFIKITSGKTYVIEGMGNNISAVRDEWRDGFFRVDVYQDANKSSLSKDTLSTAVSGRIYGPPGWKRKRVIIKVPSGGNYITVSFQRATLDAQIKYLLDDVVIYEAIKPAPEPFPKIPYKKATIPDTSIFPIGIY